MVKDSRPGREDRIGSVVFKFFPKCWEEHRFSRTTDGGRERERDGTAMCYY